MASQKRFVKIVNHLNKDNDSFIVSGTSESVDIEEIFKSKKEMEGKTLGITKWVTLTQKDLDIYSDLTNDHNWIHKAGAGKKGSPFGAPIAHGLLTLSLIPRFSYEIGAKNPDKYAKYVKTPINYGYNKIRFIDPVLVDNQVRGKFVCKSILKGGKFKTIKSITTVIIQTKNKNTGKITDAVFAESIGLTVYK
eukprot:UN07335